MIFIGPSLSDPGAHFNTNIVSCIGSGQDLVIDLRKNAARNEIYSQITTHLEKFDEQYVIYNAYENEDFFIGFKDQFPSLNLLLCFQTMNGGTLTTIGIWPYMRTYSRSRSRKISSAI